MCISSLLLRNHIQTSSPMSMEVKLPAILGNYDRPTATDKRTKRQGHREVSLPMLSLFILATHSVRIVLLFTMPM